MNRRSTRLLILAAAIAGVVACDNTKQAEQAQENQVEHAQEAQKDQAQLTQEQREEQAKLTQKQVEDQRDLVKDETKEHNEIAKSADKDIKDIREDQADLAKERNDLAQKQGEQRADLNKDQAEDRADLNKDQIEQRNKDNKKLAAAAGDAQGERGDLVNKSREKLNDLDQRATAVQTKAAGATPEEKTQVATALTGWTSKRAAAERDIEALNSVTAANLNRAKSAVDKELSSLDKVLDKAESHL